MIIPTNLVKFIQRLTVLFSIWIFFPHVVHGQSQDQNYIKTTSLLTPITDPNQIESLEDGEKIDVIQYYDGLGRLIQTNNFHASPSFSDIIQHIEYDSLGRQRYDFLPFPIEADGSYRSASRDLVMEYYNSPTDMTIPATPYPFGEKEFDNSPLNRVMKQGFPGASWQLDAHPQRFGYFSNSWNDHVFLFDYNESTHQFSTNGYYSEHTLFVNKTYDENGNLTRTFRDKSDKIILKEDSLSETQHRTYYLYDLYDNLSAVIQPEGSSQITGSFTSTAPFIDLWCFTYQYDNRRRLIEKHIPGMKKPVCMVYDSLDRVILTQDGNLKQSNLYDHQWYFTKYDALGRPVLEGLYRNRTDTTREGLREVADDYFFHHSYYETRTGVQYTTQQGYTDNAFPPLDSCEILKVFHYDDYDFDADGQDDFTYNPFSEFGDQNLLEHPRGMPTGTKCKILLEPILQDPFLFTVNFYDRKSRIIQQQLRNHSGHLDTLTTKYNFAGDVLYTRYSFASAYDYHVICDSLVYDHARRLKETYKKTDDQAWFQESDMTYNELGQLIEKNLHRTGTSTFLQSLDYSYNIRGWLSGINIRSNGNDTRDLFYQHLLYDSAVSTLESNPQYNGNISTEIWRHYGNSSSNGYGYSYDDVNRLTGAVFGTKTSGTWTVSDLYSMPFIEYDKNGNISQLRRHGKYGTSWLVMDDLVYYYSGNQVHYVDDNMQSYYGGFQDNGHYYSSHNQEYLYDNNGNLTKDLNKGITSIVYNNLNLPVKIELENNKRITFLYDANGTKLRKCYYEDNHLMSTTNYYGNFVFKDDHINYILTCEGRLKYNDHDQLFYAEYFIKDHLGNVRDVITTDPAYSNSNTEITDYYPFGQEIPLSGSTDNQIKYNSKELQIDAGLNWYDYGRRFYDPVLGRFPSLDPKADAFVELSPYNYASNNPVTKIDLWGLQGVDFFELGPMLQKESLKATGQRIPTVQDAVQYSDLPEKQAQIDAYTAAGAMGLAEVGGALLEVALPAVAETKLGQAVIKFFGGNTDDAVKATQGPYSNLPDSKSVGPGKNFTSSQKQNILEANKAKNNGVLKSDLSGKTLDTPVQSQKGVKANMNQAEVDHITPKKPAEPNVKSGSNSYKNAQVLSKEENILKSNK